MKTEQGEAGKRKHSLEIKEMKQFSKWVFIYENILIYTCMPLDFIVLMQIILYVPKCTKVFFKKHLLQTVSHFSQAQLTLP